MFEKYKIIKKNIFLIFKITLTFFILYLIFLKIDLKSFSLIFFRVNIGYVFLALLVFLAQFLIATLKWQKLVDFFKVKLNFRFYLKFNLIGLFYSTIMPGGIFVGDLIKGYKIFKFSEDRRIIINSILMDRVSGFLGLLVSIIVMYFIIQPQRFPYYRGLMTLSLGLLIFLVVFLFSSKKIFIFLLKIVERRFLGLRNYLEKGFRIVNTYSDHPGLLLGAILAGVLIYLVNGFCVYLTALALGSRLSFFDLFLVNCLANFAVIVAPITFFGLGIRESSFIYFLSFLGTNKESALILSLLLSLIYLLLSLGGGVIEAIHVFTRKKDNQLNIKIN